jgi:hypothetical protein
MTSKVEQWVTEMREYETFLDSELRRVRRLINAADGVESRTNTTEILQEMFQDNPGTEYTAAEAEQEMRKRGWVTDSGDPVNAVRAALARLKNLGEIESVGRGRFRLTDDTPPWEEPSPPLDDPWGSPPPPTPSVDDEPPF